jgi:thymidine kinase
MHMPQRGRIELIMGCMFAGKSTELLRRCRKHEITGKKVLKVKFCADNRYDLESIATHNGMKEKAIPSTSLVHDLRDYWRKFDVIGIDEGQFFTDIVEFAEMAADEQKIVIIASLQGTFLRGCFQNILTLIPKCEKIKKLSAICKLCK